jgi:GGDEF domain-containing protein
MHRTHDDAVVKPGETQVQRLEHQGILFRHGLFSLLAVTTRAELHFRPCLYQLQWQWRYNAATDSRDEQQAISVARYIVESLDPEYTIDDQILRLCCCIGTSICPGHHERQQELIRNTDKAMFEARQRAGKYCIYSAKTL